MPVVLLASLDCLADFRIDVINRADTIDFSVLALLDVEILQWKGLTVLAVNPMSGTIAFKTIPKINPKFFCLFLRPHKIDKNENKKSKICIFAKVLFNCTINNRQGQLSNKKQPCLN